MLKISRTWMAAVIGFYGLIVGLAYYPSIDVDIAMYLAICRRFFEEGGFPKYDPFIFSISNYSWHIYHQWLGYFPWYGWSKLFGISGLVWLKIILLGVIFYIPIALARKLNLRSFFIFVPMALALGAASIRLNERTSLFSEFAQALLIAILAVASRGRTKVLRLLPVLFLLWVNFHPGFHPGLVILFIAFFFHYKEWTKSDFKEYFLILVGCFLATFINPLGIQGFLYPLTSVGSAKWDIMKIYNFEWMPTFGKSFRGSFAVICWSLLCIQSILLWALARPRKNMNNRNHWLWLGVTMIFLMIYGSHSIRFVTVAGFSLMTLNVFMLSLKPIEENSVIKTHEVMISRTFAGAMLCLGLYTLVFNVSLNGSNRKHGGGFDPRVFPIQAAEWYRNHQQPNGNVWNEHSFGAYLAFAWNGNPKIFYHGFMDDMIFYGTNYLNISQTVGEFERIVTQFNLKTFFVKTFDPKSEQLPLLYYVLSHSNAFHLVYADDTAMIFIRP